MARRLARSRGVEQDGVEAVTGDGRGGGVGCAVPLGLTGGQPGGAVARQETGWRHGGNQAFTFHVYPHEFFLQNFWLDFTGSILYKKSC
jgi:hypothetical protein